MNKVTLLPKWILPSTIPSIYDTESGTWVEMAAKLYGAIRDLQNTYNIFVDEINKTITEFIEGAEKDQKCFEDRMIKTLHDYLDYLDSKIELQDKNIDEAIKFMKDNIVASVTTVIGEMRETGELSQAILDALDGVETRLANLENADNLINEKLLDVQSRMHVIEGTKTYFNYIADTKELNLIIDERSGE